MNSGFSRQTCVSMVVIRTLQLTHQAGKPSMVVMTASAELSLLLILVHSWILGLWEIFVQKLLAV